jgi:L-threonylcarbamoyladenylate synthase
MARQVPFTDETTEEAAALLRAGALVSFPTETVYGLGANALDDAAVAGIYAAKDRPSFNPLIVHVPDIETARHYGRFTDLAEQVATTLWPGPLSLVLPRTEGCPLSKLVSAGLDTGAIRVPARAPARRLLVAARVPVAGPSANKSGQLSPTEARHVVEGFGDEVALVLDGGSCAVGLESTVLDLSTETPTLLRAGGVTHEALEEVIGGHVALAGVDDHAPKSPGMLSRHYAPRTPLRMNATEVGDGEALLGFGGSDGAVVDLSPAGDLLEAATNLFRILHELDVRGYVGIAVVPIPENGLGRAINDRLRRGAEAPTLP